MLGEGGRRVAVGDCSRGLQHVYTELRLQSGYTELWLQSGYTELWLQSGYTELWLESLYNIPKGSGPK